MSCDPGVEAMIVNELASEQVEGRLRVECGDLAASQEQTLILAVALKGSHPEGASLGVQCVVSDRDRVLGSDPVSATWRSVTMVEDALQPVNRVVRLAVASLLAEAARALALAASRRGDTDAARRIRRQMVDDLRAMAPGDKGVLALIDQLHHDELACGD